MRVPYGPRTLLPVGATDARLCASFAAGSAVAADPVASGNGWIANSTNSAPTKRDRQNCDRRTRTGKIGASTRKKKARWH
jgi:hypothetical protein